MTLLEVLVVLGVIGLMVALLLPAVQSAREASRRAACTSQMRQVMIAVIAYEGAFGAYPATVGRFDPQTRRQKQYSAFTQLLAQMDHAPLFHSINFDFPLEDFYMNPNVIRLGDKSNTTAIRTTIATLICPSDGGPGGVAGWSGVTNYRFNLGAERRSSQQDSTAGIFSSYTSSSAGRVRDGLSHTVALSEKLRGQVEGDLDLRSAMIALETGLGSRTSLDEAFERCAGVRSGSESFGATGLTWFVGSPSQTCYTQVHPPNSTVPDCYAPGTSPPIALVGARSHHPGGVNAAMADGSVRFVRDSIDRRLWMAVGTRDGGEIVDAF